MCGIQKCEPFPYLPLSFTSSQVFWVLVGPSFKTHAPILSSQEDFSPLLVSSTYGLHSYFIYFHIPLFLHTITSLLYAFIWHPLLRK